MNKLVRALIAGWGAKKIGGGCISTIIVFIIIYYALGTCNSHPVQTVPQKRSGIQAPTQYHSSNYFVLDINSIAPIGSILPVQGETGFTKFVTASMHRY